MIRDRLIYNSGESNLKAGIYKQVACTGIFCKGQQEMEISVEEYEMFPKCAKCGQKAIWTSVNNSGNIQTAAIYGASMLIH